MNNPRNPLWQYQRLEAALARLPRQLYLIRCVCPQTRILLYIVTYDEQLHITSYIGFAGRYSHAEAQQLLELIDPAYQPHLIPEATDAH